MLENLPGRQGFLLGQQGFALLALVLDLLYQPGIARHLGPVHIEGFLILFLAHTDVGQLIAENQHLAAQFLQFFSHNRYSEGNQISQLFDLRFQLPQQGVVRLDLLVQLATVGDNAATFQRLGRHTLVDGGALFQLSRRMAAVVDAFRMTGQLQATVRRCGPHLAPCEQLFFTVPPRRDGVLPAVPGAFGVFARTNIAMRLG